MYFECHQIRSLSLNLVIKTIFSFPRLNQSIAKMTANGTAKDYSVISQKDPEKDGIEMKVEAFY